MFVCAVNENKRRLGKKSHKTRVYSFV